MDLYGAIIVDVPIQNPEIPVIAWPRSNQPQEIYAYPSKDDDGNWRATFPRILEGNWNLTMHYMRPTVYPGQTYKPELLVTIFAGAVIHVKMGDGAARAS